MTHPSPSADRWSAVRPLFAASSALRLALVRHRGLRRGAQAGVAAVVAASTWAVLRSAEQEARSWGTLRTVVVAERAVRPGDAVAGATRTERRPAVLVPPDALTEVPAGAHASQQVSVGEVLVATDVEPSPVGGRLADGRRAVVIGLPPDLLAVLAVGDAVGVVVEGEAVADGVVAHVGTEAVAVGLPEDSAAHVADAVLLGTATVVVVGRVPP